ncbi:MAG: hypothetical protein ACPGYY_06260 [Bacteroidia bacterium]
MESLKFLLFVILLSCCKPSIESKTEWNKADLYQIKDITSTQKGDTTIVLIKDNSYIYFDEYNIWKNNYFIWKNRENLRQVSILKIRSIQDGRDFAMDGIYLNHNINAIINRYANNSTFDSISHLVLSTFTATEILNFRSAHNYLNGRNKDYEGTFVDLLYNFSLCNDSCFTSRRLKLIGKMLYEVKLNDFWHDNNRIDAENFVLKLNQILRMKGIEEIIE